MAIKIPSKYILSKQNPKVRDNTIDRVEVEANEVSVQNDYEVIVSSKDIYDGFTDGVQMSSIVKDDDTYGSGWAFYSFYMLTPKYLKNVEVKIPKLKENSLVSKVFHDYTEADGKIDPDIKVNVRATKYTGILKSRVENYVKGDNFSVYFDAPMFSKKEETSFDGFPEEHSYKYTPARGDMSLTSEVSLTNNDTVATPEFTETETHYILKFTILCGYEESKGGGYAEYSNGSQTWFEEKGYCTRIVPNSVEITIYGNTVGVKLEDKTVYINGDTSKKVYSVEGNELMQISNYSSEGEGEDTKEPISITFTGRGDYVDIAFSLDITSPFEMETGDKYYYNGDVAQVINYTTNGYEIWVQPDGAIHNVFKANHKATIEVYDATEVEKASLISAMYDNTRVKYENGKETATIVCSMADFYGYENGRKYISAIGAEDAPYTVTTELVDTIEIVHITLKNIYKNPVEVSYTLDGEPHIYQIPPYLSYGDFIFDARASFKLVSVKTKTPMGFKIGDYVVPMVYGVDGNDTPMSLMEDGVAKYFQVLGVKYSYDGEPLQEISLKEVKLQKLGSPKIYFNDDDTMLIIEGIDKNTEELVILVNDEEKKTIGIPSEEETVSVASLVLYSSDRVKVICRAEGYLESESNTTVYIKLVATPEIAVVEDADGTEYLSITKQDTHAMSYEVTLNNEIALTNIDATTYETVYVPLSSLKIISSPNTIGVTAKASPTSRFDDSYEATVEYMIKLKPTVIELNPKSNALAIPNTNYILKLDENGNVVETVSQLTVTRHIYIDGFFKTTTNQYLYNLSELRLDYYKSYKVTVTLYKTGYRESDMSNSVTYNTTPSLPNLDGVEMPPMPEISDSLSDYYYTVEEGQLYLYKNVNLEWLYKVSQFVPERMFYIKFYTGATVDFKEFDSIKCDKSGDTYILAYGYNGDWTSVAYQGEGTDRTDWFSDEYRFIRFPNQRQEIKAYLGHWLDMNSEEIDPL